MRNVSNEVLVLRGSVVVARFGYSADEEIKTPARRAAAFLQEVLTNSEHELHGALLNGELEKVDGHPTVIAVQQKLSLA